MKEHKWSRRTLYLAAVVAIVASTSGFALASVLSTPTTVTQTASYYEGNSAGAVGYGTPTLGISATPLNAYAPAANGCTRAAPASVVDNNNGVSVNLVVSGLPGGDCATNNFAEEFSVNYTSAGGIQNNNITVYSELAGGPVVVDPINMTMDAGGGAFNATVHVYVDYGGILPPAGIDVLDLVIH